MSFRQDLLLDFDTSGGDCDVMARRLLELNPAFRISTLRRGGWSGEDTAHQRHGMLLAELSD